MGLEDQEMPQVPVADGNILGRYDSSNTVSGEQLDWAAFNEVMGNDQQTLSSPDPSSLNDIGSTQPWSSVNTRYSETPNGLDDSVPLTQRRTAALDVDSIESSQGLTTGQSYPTSTSSTNRMMYESIPTIREPGYKESGNSNTDSFGPETRRYDHYQLANTALVADNSSTSSLGGQPGAYNIDDRARYSPLQDAGDPFSAVDTSVTSYEADSMRSNYDRESYGWCAASSNPSDVNEGVVSEYPTQSPMPDFRQASPYRLLERDIVPYPANNPPTYSNDTVAMTSDFGARYSYVWLLPGHL